MQFYFIVTLSSKIGFISGLLVFLFIILFTNLEPSNPKVTYTAASAVLMAIWWMTEAIPLAATSLLPFILFPLMGVLKGEEIASSYFNSVIFLFLGGFLLALAMEEWGLHKRIALKIINQFGGSPSSIVIGFMIATAFLSMWISNTAAALMMLPIGLAIIHKMEKEFGEETTKNFSITLMLSLAYACSLGGIATLIGTPPNLAFIRIYKIIFPEAPAISFGSWMLLAIPISILMLIFTSFLLSKVFYKFDKNLRIDPAFIKEEYLKLGKATFEEKTVAVVFGITALLWIFRADLNLGFIQIPGWQKVLPFPDYIDDGTVAIGMSFLLFFIPSKKEKRTLLDVKVFSKIPWGIILLFGGGFALAEAFTKGGLSEFIGKSFYNLNFSPLLIAFSIAFVINFLTELTSNTATAQMILPIAASLSVALGIHPLLLMIIATISSSMAFMLPVATPPNTIVFASERLKIANMVKAGFAVNIMGVILVTIIVWFLGNILFDFSSFPDWAK
ncbi:MAG: sodium:dicarboxylate symporter [Ignavibacteria bacterium RBG_16_34_14]|nr:MAG: sodium:dicarboxylate symporter [Ignavibacteria bacterium RBG_16_34_14]